LRTGLSLFADRDRIDAQSLLSLHSGLHFANPIPEESAIPKSEMDGFITEAIKYANDAGASGKDNTPFVLAKIQELTDGRSVKANRALVASNVKCGTLIAKELQRLEQNNGNSNEM
jgi:pseudouridylate synthase / pseudouridine kinase